ncbi:hypothetical protein [Accumulibacter sp.]|uniref:Cas10/Cmr2 second palm domain-containing protein n=1 Tax=Accumulibacter sp. TaxID=2053492 RepID=UPI0035B07A7D
MARQHLLFIETSGNQSYIYATNKLRENIGASELTYRAGTQWVLDAAGFPEAPTGEPRAYRKWLAAGPKRLGVEVVLATSGKALLVVAEREQARQILAVLTRRAATAAPGLSVSGAIVDLPSRQTDDVARAIGAVHRRFNANRDLLPTPAQRFAMLPFCQPCATSGLPASDFGSEAAGRDESIPLAAPALAKRACAGDWFARIRQVFRNNDADFYIAASADQLEREFEDLPWLAVVHSDGNGLGQIMMQFDRWLQPGDDYLATLRDFSVQLDEATENAFYRACQRLRDAGAAREPRTGERRRLPVVPLLLGGDDLTALVHGHHALPFARSFLRSFEDESSRQPTIARIAQHALGAGRLSVAAGVAIVKTHFPFHSAYDLAESLLRSAKAVKRKVPSVDGRHPHPCSALDFHVLFDAAYTSLAAIREQRRTAADGRRLWGGPYVVTREEELGASPGREWAHRHHLDALLARVNIINRRDAEQRAQLPRSQLHMLREALAQGKDVADARLRELGWLNEKGLADLLEASGSLFDEATDPGATRFLDALGSAGFWGDEAVETSATEEREQ